MRIVRLRDEGPEAVAAARREAIAAFGDGTLYVERLIDRPKHVEVQIFGDSSGRIAHLFERECSVQRRHQKIIEESPSPSIDDDLRSRMAEAAVAAGRAVGYRNAGTVELLVESSDVTARFYFLEMNTRLQVEHGITEEVVGVDLVRAQILVAAGALLPWGAGLDQRGHAIEARVYAEDPAEGFLPQAGRILLYREPRAPGIRIDSGVMEGNTVPVHYDPLIAKIIATAETRELAIRRLTAALRDFPILGIQTNIPFLLRVLDTEEFRLCTIDTGFLDGPGETLARSPLPAMPPHVVAAVEAHCNFPTITEPSSSCVTSQDPWASLSGWL
jgi:acetyl/propionyl-CoA carboxylase alpha subunit